MDDPVAVLRSFLLSVARVLDLIVVSGDRQGSYFATGSVEKLDQESGRWLRETDAVAIPTLAQLRREVFELLVPDDSVEADERLLRELGEQQYWRPAK